MFKKFINSAHDWWKRVLEELSGGNKLFRILFSFDWIWIRIRIRIVKEKIINDLLFR